MLVMQMDVTWVTLISHFTFPGVLDEKSQQRRERESKEFPCNNLVKDFRGDVDGTVMELGQRRSEFRERE